VSTADRMAEQIERAERFGRYAKMLAEKGSETYAASAARVAARAALEVMAISDSYQRVTQQEGR
jgi:HEPN domain-containing protein